MSLCTHFLSVQHNSKVQTQTYINGLKQAKAVIAEFLHPLENKKQKLKTKASKNAPEIPIS